MNLGDRSSLSSEYGLNSNKGINEPVVYICGGKLNFRLTFVDQFYKI